MIYRLFIDDERDPRDVTWGKTWQEMQCIARMIGLLHEIGLM